MTTARTVPVTTEMDGDELDALDAWHLARQHGLRKIVVESFVRFRYGDGFTNSRALALQVCLAVVPFLLALTGLASDIDEERPAAVVAHVVDSLSPGSGEGDALTSAVDESDTSERAGEVALVLGLGFALVSMTTAMAQVERGANRIYGIRRDRKALHKYGRAAVLTAVLAAPVSIGFVMLVGGGALGEAMAEELRLVRRMRSTGGTVCAGRSASPCSSSRSRCCSTTRHAAGSPPCPGSRSGRASPWCSARSPRPGWRRTSR